MTNNFTTIVGESRLYTIRTYIDKFMPDVAIDLSFQSRARWKLEQGTAFINSCLLDMNISKFIIVDLLMCRDSFIKDSDDYNYFNGWLLKGKSFLNVDSNNRNTTLIDFVGNNIPIANGNYTIKGRQFSVTKGKNDSFKTMDEDFKNIFFGNNISVFMITKATRQQLSDVFMRMNSGLPLNHFEKVNCIWSDTCNTIRELADKHGNKFIESPMFKKDDKNRRIIDGFIAHCSYLYVKGVGLSSFSKPIHSKWYSKDSPSNAIIGNFKKDFNSYMKLVGDKIKLFHHKYVFFDLFYLICEQERLDKKIQKDSNIVQDFINVYTRLYSNETADLLFHDKDGKEVVEHGTYPFKHFAKGEGLNTPTRFFYYKLNGFDIQKYFYQLDPKRSRTKIEKQATAVDMGWKDSDGDEYIPETLFDGSLDDGHMIAHGLGGKTEPSNMVIEKMSKNRSKGTQETEVVL